MAVQERHPSSYRDPAGFLFYSKGRLFRQVNQSYRPHYEHLIESGLYQHLVDQQLLIPHEEVRENIRGEGDWFLTLKPEMLQWISYPYEWCFDQWKDAALATLAIAQEALNYGMVLKDASAYNVQWHKGKMMFIDSLSFEVWNEREPWIAYRQFCEHFLAPLVLMHYRQLPLQELFVSYPDGIPLNIAAALLPWRSRFHLHTYLHLHLHSKVSAMQQGNGQGKTAFSAAKMRNLLSSLQTAISNFKFSGKTGVWSGYYEEAAQRDDYLLLKRECIAAWLDRYSFQTAWDAGANEGNFSRLLAERNIHTVSTDFDHYAINRLYNAAKADGLINILPLLLDLSKPSPAIGLNNRERSAFFSRFHVNLVMALALVHHLAIGKNIPFDEIAEMFSRCGKFLLIEFVPPTDEKVKQLLSQKKRSFDQYTEGHFQDAFAQKFVVLERKEIGNTGRILYLMKKHD
jgi:hypothetical protein